MGRKKMTHAFIENESKRKESLKKRRSCLLKKVNEISTLCGVDACGIVFGPNEDEAEVAPSPYEALRVISKFRERDEQDRHRKMDDQESFLKQRVKKTEDQLKKLVKDNREKEMKNLMYQCLSVGEVPADATLVDLNDLAWVIDQNLREINIRMMQLNGQGQAERAHGAHVANN